MLANDPESNGDRKTEMQALQNHNLLIALAHSGGSSAPQHFPMPVRCLKIAIQNR